MSLFIASLNSGSNGNCYYIGNEQDAVLVDAGLSCREVEKRMKRLSLSMDRVRAVFISHEHGDHIRGLESIAGKYQIKVYITAGTLQHSRLRLDKNLVVPFEAYQPVMIEGLSVLAFPKDHDAADPHSFIVAGNGVKVGVFTDIGVVCTRVMDHFKQCHAAFLEANYDEDMLERGRYPYHLKKRISGGKGHLSNRQALALFTEQRPDFMSHLFLSHLSKENNCPKRALDLFAAYAGAVQVVVASRDRETEVYRICDDHPGAAVVRPYVAVSAVQASLF